MKIACIDLEGVLIPELWPHIAQETGIASLSLTTREFPNYPELMRTRIETLRRNSLTLATLQSITANITPFPDAQEFLHRLQKEYDVSIISDCFHELIGPILNTLGSPKIKCHRFNIDPAGYVDHCVYFNRQGKETHVAQALTEGAKVLAVGDAYNDLNMLRLAHHGFLIRPSNSTRAAAPELPVVNSLSEVFERVAFE
ncbi:bifunctional phosphoserine phosphatase/homoserine phosphotransferase ThrH [Halomonas desiderata]|jgi:phosphoserine/homoserine phosphotransferase|uniref:bifunctional phosphoserine phosphatase/homoserine phosphotransferase ThrH n=1 Tax=Halomonadaceae TaxID=28256 RepID=UPI000A3C393A|nr:MULTISPECIES: bifunctional phosphoserine phosphatase/homoserine phosphotransferase ThrH [Halomonas]MCE8040148.1 bifunctional phosphoserine phosphatase/homoserine phosphotransferase ThrH [Halomonas sp. MCCC 1A11062]NIC37057.1 bifunctional phosphoserine phosphatase/homoserine phosphotransferase ThrH [Halomonas desiderata]OUE46783.1 phosphoserine phosphatase [Halomonas desiderata SP1]